MGLWYHYEAALRPTPFEEVAWTSSCKSTWAKFSFHLLLIRRPRSFHNSRSLYTSRVGRREMTVKSLSRKVKKTTKRLPLLWKPWWGWHRVQQLLTYRRIVVHRPDSFVTWMPRYKFRVINGWLSFHDTDTPIDSEDHHFWLRLTIVVMNGAVHKNNELGRNAFLM